MTNVISIQKPTKAAEIKVTVELPADTAKLVMEFVTHNQHSHNAHGTMNVDKLVRMLLEDVAAAVKDGSTWQGAHMALVLNEHGYRTCG